jgi:Na+-driven multidrug efflux pump
MVTMKVHEVNVLDTTKPIGSIIWSLAWPAILEQVLQVMVNYVDSAMVGSLGAAETAAISVNSSTIWLINGLMNALAIGFAVLMARHLGAGNRGIAKSVVRQALACQSLFGLGISLIMLVIAR